MVKISVISGSLLFLSIITASYGKEISDSNSYRLGPQDRIEIKIHDLRAGTGEAHQWPAFDGEFIVNSSGIISVPLLGEVQAGGGTTEDLANSLANRIQSKVGLAQTPSAAVQVVKYRPFYISGTVEKPGEYDYRPGLTVIQAVSISGGVLQARDSSLLGFERDALTQRGELRVLAADRKRLLVRQERLDAEVSDAASFTYNSGSPLDKTDPELSAIMKEETLLFDANKNFLKSQLDILAKLKSLLEKELSSLADKDKNINLQIELLNKELVQVTGLVSKGLAVAPRQFAVEQSLAAYENNRIDIQVARLRAQQDLSKADREIIDFRSKRKKDTLLELGDVRSKLSLISEKATTASMLVFQSEVRSPLSVMSTNISASTESQFEYSVTRFINNKFENIKASENFKIEPGDVLKVAIHGRSTGDAGNRSLNNGPLTTNQ